MSLTRGEWSAFVVGVVAGAATAVLVLSSQFKKSDRSSPLKRAAKRVGGVCRLKKGMYDQYTQLHDHTWDEVMERMYKQNMRNFTVYLHKESNLMFHHFEYVGGEEDFEKDMSEIGKDPVVQYWWSYCEPCQEPFHWSGPPPSQGGNGGVNGAWWDPLICLNHCGAWPVMYSNQWPDPDFVKNNPHGRTSTKEKPPPVHNRPT